MRKGGVVFIEINAKDNYDFGFKLGKALKKEIHYRIKKNKGLYKKMASNGKNFLKLEEEAKKFIPAIQKNFPHLLIEAKAMAEGAEASFDELMVLICENEILKFNVLHCTCLALKTDDGSILLGHNEDWDSSYRKNGLALVRGKIGKNKFLASMFIGNLVGSSVGLNSNGISYSDNSLTFSRVSRGIPRSFHLRALLDAKNLNQAVKILDTSGSAISNTLLIFSNKKMIDVEELWKRDQIFESKKWIVHTNHPLLKKDQTMKIHRDSFKRYKRACEILSGEKEFSIKTVLKILKDHKGEICDHKKRKYAKDHAPTIASIIVNPKEKWMMVCHGNPCKGKYVKYKL